MKISLLALLFLILIFAFSIFVIPTHAAPQGLITCGREAFGGEQAPAFCNICDLIALFQRLVNQAVEYFAAPIFALMLGYGGFLIVIAGIRGGNAQSYSAGKKVITNAVIGIVIIFGSWLLIDTILKALGAYQTGSSFGPWHVIECTSAVIEAPKGPTHFACNGDKCEEVKGGGSDTCKVGGDRNNCIEHVECNADRKICELKQAPGLDSCSLDNGGQDAKCAAADMCKGVECKYKGQTEVIDTTKPAPSADCTITGGSSISNAIDEGINKAGNSMGADIDTAKLVHAIISQESHGNIKAVSGAGACGLMQVVPSSGKRFAARCGTTEAEANTCDFYTNPANAAKSVCIGTLLLGAPEVANACGKTVRGLAAGFNGGGGGSKDACAPSADCGSAAGSGQCKISSDQAGETKRWECLWEDTAHTKCNADLASNYAETRRYVPKVMYCYNKF